MSDLADSSASAATAQDDAPSPAAGTDLRAIFTRNDVRGAAEEQLGDDVARALGAAFADHLASLGQRALIVGRDMRLGSPRIAEAVIDGAVRRGAIVADAGLTATDQLYCASGLHDAAGVQITASHNPPQDDGMKLCLPGAVPLSRDTGLEEIRERAERHLDAGEIIEQGGGSRTDLETLEDYADTLLGLVPGAGARALRIAVDAGSGMAGLTVPAVLERLGTIELDGLHLELDGSFPHHRADPLDPSTLTELQERVRTTGADMALAFDGDADRCVVLDETGAVVTPSALSALIAEREIARARAAGEATPTVVVNLVSSRHVTEAVEAAGGRAVRSPVGHSLIKDLMARESAVFGGEHSAHYYFRDFFHADSGLLAALHVIAALAEGDQPLSALLAAHSPYAASGEINQRLGTAEQTSAALERVRRTLIQEEGTTSDELDGLSLVHWDEVADPRQRWWLSLRPSSTEPLLRLNVEAVREDTMQEIRDRALSLIAEEPSSGGAPARPELLPEGSSGVDVPRWVRGILRCPDCGGELRDVASALQCLQCRRVHEVDGGIPVLIAGRVEP